MAVEEQLERPAVAAGGRAREARLVDVAAPVSQPGHPIRTSVISSLPDDGSRVSQISTARPDAAGSSSKVAFGPRSSPEAAGSPHPASVSAGESET